MGFSAMAWRLRLRQSTKAFSHRVHAMIIIAGLLIAFVLLIIFSNHRTRNCRWRENRAVDRVDAKFYKCMSCGAETFTTNGKPPFDCKSRQINHTRPR
jgi:DNA-directed RNA polymerase subunit RPC12/RpoP